MDKIQLFCIPYAGGNADCFDGLKKYLPQEVELVAFDYAGHGARGGEDFYPTFDDMVRDMAMKLNGCFKPERKTVIFGYSMGSVVVYEMVARGLVKAEITRLFLAAHEAPGEDWGSAEYVKLDDLAFAHKMMEFGGFDKFQDRFLENRHFRRMFFEPIRQDYRLIADYKRNHDIRPDVPVTFFYAPGDVCREDALKWSSRFAEEPEYIEIGNNHFFIKEYPMELAELITERLKM